MKRKLRTRIGSILLTAAMLLSLLPTTALAAENTVSSEAELRQAIVNAQDGDIIKLTNDITMDPLYAMEKGYKEEDDAPLDPAIIIDDNITLDLNNHKISWDTQKIPGVGDAAIYYTLCFLQVNGATVTIDGNGTIDTEFGMNNSFGVNIANNGSVTVKNGTYTGATTAIQVQKGTLTILDGTFEQAATIGEQAPGFAKYVINCIDANFKNGTARIYAKGGTFCFDPAGKPEASDITYVADGYVSVADGENYKVIPAVAEADGKYYATLAEAVDAVVSSPDKAGTVTLLKDAQGSGIGLFNTKGHVDIDLTIDFGGHTYTAGDPAVGSVGTESQAFHLEKGNTVTLKNGTITVAPDSQKTTMLIQNYCNLTLDNIDLIGNGPTQYIISCNYGDTVLKDVNISGTHENLVALDLMHWLGTSYADQAPTMSIQNTAENTISGSVDVYCYGAGADSCPSKPIMTITGGTFTTDVKDYCATGYTTKQDGSKYVVVPKDGMEADSSASGNTSSGTVGGTFNPSTENGDNVDTSDSTIEINVATGSNGSQNTDVKTTAVEITNDALESVSFTNYDVEITTDVAVLTVSQEAWADITQNANGKNVTLGITKGGTEANPVYTLTAQADGENVYSADNASGKITVAVKATAEAPIYYVREDGSLENMNAAFDNGVITWDVSHFSDYVAASGKVGLVEGGTVSFYDTMSAALIAMRGTTGTITLLDSITDNVTIPSGKTILLELNGKTLTNNAGSHTITVTLGSNLTVQDSVGGGFVDNVSHACAAILNNGTATLNGGKYDRSKENGQNSENAGGNSYYAIVNHGTMTINDGVTVAQNGHFSSMIENGYQNYNSGNASTGYVFGTNAANPSLTINGGNFSGGLNTVKNDDGGKLEINGGRFSNVSQAVVLNWNTATITGGDFTVTEPGVNSVILNGFADSNLDKGELKINGGTFTSTTGAPVLSTMILDGYTAGKSGTILIQNGILNGNIVLTDENASGGSFQMEGGQLNGSIINQGNADMQIKGGTVTGQVSNNGSGTITVTGGTFPNADISGFVPSGSLMVTFNSNGGSAVATRVVANNASITLPTTTRPGYNFLGWYLNGSRVGGAGDAYTVTGNVTLVAQWSYNGSTGGGSSSSGDYMVSVDKTANGKVTVSPSRADKGDTVTITVKPNDGYVLDELTVTAKNGGSVKLTWKDDNKYTFTMPGSQVSIEATFVKEDGQSVDLPFADVVESDWYYDAVQYVYENDLMNGTSATTFAPNSQMTRAMIWTVLAAYEGENTSGGATWYEAGQKWAMENGISDGSNPNGAITREQLAVMLWRYAGSPKAEMSLASYTDASAVSSWAVEAMAWAIDNGLISGMGNGILAPQGNATRAQVATIMMQFVENI